MRSKRHLNLFLLGGLAAGLVAAGCGSSSTSTTSGAGGGTTSSTTTTTTTTTTHATTTTGSTTSTTTGGSATTNHSKATASDAAVDPTAAVDPVDLVDANTTSDWYKFTAVKGDRINIIAEAQSLITGGTGDDATVVDTVITVYGTDGTTVIAQDDDGFPRFSTDSSLYTTIPADGTYYYTVSAYNTAFPATPPVDVSTITTLTYDTYVFHTKSLGTTEANASSTNATAATAATVTYTASTASTAVTGDYFENVIDGSFSAAGETQFFTFTPPANDVLNSVTGTTARAEFFFQPKGKSNGDGSSANVKVTAYAADGTTVLAQADQANYLDGDNANQPLDFSFPITLGQKYYLTVQNEGGATATDFYYAVHDVTFGGTAEQTTPHATSATAQALVTPGGINAGYFLADSTFTAAGEIDWYSVVPTAGANTLSFGCTGQRAGSGVRGLTATAYGADGTTVLGTGALTETATTDLGTTTATDIKLTTTPAKIFLKVTDTSQAAGVTGAYYSCVINTATN